MTDMQKKNIRRVMMLAGTGVIVVIGLVMYLFSGRYASTDNAYIKSDIVSISPQVTGPLIDVPVEDNMQVTAGTVLLRIDPTPFKIALAQAEANLLTARANVEKLKADYLQQQAGLQSSRADLLYNQQQYDRIIKLKASKAISQTDIDESTKNLKAAKESASMMEHQAAGVLAQLDGDPDIKIEDHPGYKAALAARDKAALDVEHTTVLAPFDGIVYGAPKAGDYARASAPSMSLVKSSHVWIEANFKETQLTRMKNGQPVKIDVDSYPSHEWSGHIESMGPATGAEFSILPAQNSTGNWVKVVQRIPVRIAIDQSGEAPPLRAGMSTEVKVDTGSYPHLP